MSKVNTAEVVIPSNIQASWQKIVNLSAELIGVPSALIMRIHKEHIDVFAANDNLKHAYSKGDTQQLGGGLYCETVIETQQPLCIPNCLEDEKWRDNPDVALGMIAYFGLPINWPNGEPFGTLCVLVGAEALLRWKNQVLGDISNEGLIKLAEQNGLIFELGNFVLRSAIEKAAEWHKLVSQFSVAINISSVQLRDPYFARQVQELLEMCHVPPECIELEITEGGLISDEALATETLHKLKKLGVTLSLDDFGTGYASFSYLKKYPFDAIKIDKGFLNHLEESAQDKEIVRSIIHVAKKLDLKVTVEGVETQQHEDFW